MTGARLLGGRYEVGPPLGYGGMAEVHLGRDLRLGRDVAVKVLRTDLARDPGFQARFRREAQNAAALNHPAIVAVYDTGEDADASGLAVPYIVMEYVEGQTLKDVLLAETRLMPQRALEITADVCAALDFSHRHGIVHRDIKPANVMLTPGGTVKVMDFGIARAVASASATMTATSAVIGTAQYLSPEQARGENVDARSDVYSTGCLLYELLVGEPPFTGDNPVSVAYQHVREDPVPPSERNPELGPALDAIVLKAMAKNPANRYQSAGEMRADLLRAAAGRPVAATPVLPSEERTAVIGAAPRTAGGYPLDQGAQEPPRRRWVTVALVSLAVVTIFALAAFATSFALKANPGEVTVPRVLGQTEAAARATLEGKGFVVSVVPRASTTVDKGKVIGQSPEPDQEAERRSDVEIQVGQGPDTVAVPKVVGLLQDGAYSLLDAANLKHTETEQDSDKPKGMVIAASPPVGEVVPKETSITLTVSRGNLVTVPDVRGKSRVEATATLRGLGFNVTTSFRTSDAEPGTVISQTPDQNTAQKRATTIALVLAAAPAPSVTPSSSPTPTASPTPTKSPVAEDPDELFGP